MTTKGEPLSGKIAVVAAGSSPRSPADPDVARKNGRVFASWDLAEEYGNDADGTRPHFVRWLRENMPEVAAAWKKADDGFYAYWGQMPYGMPG
jgi:hypothetical protein